MDLLELPQSIRAMRDSHPFKLFVAPDANGLMAFDPALRAGKLERRWVIIADVSRSSVMSHSPAIRPALWQG